MNGSYHITYFPPNVSWPNGGWSVYQITGDEIAQRIKFDADGKVTHRHSWCGYLGIAEKLSGVQELIARDMESKP